MNMLRRFLQPTLSHDAAPQSLHRMETYNVNVGLNTNGGKVTNCSVDVGFGSSNGMNPCKDNVVSLESIKKSFMMRYSVLKAVDLDHDQIKGFGTAEEYANAQLEALKAVGLGEDLGKKCRGKVDHEIEEPDKKNDVDDKDKKGTNATTTLLANNPLLGVAVLFLLALLAALVVGSN